MSRKKVTIAELLEKKQKSQKITMITAYDYPTASILDQVEIDTILVGDSLGNVVLGYDSTVPVTMDEMIHHSKAVARGVKSSFMIGDMPFLSYQVSTEKAIENAGRFIKEAGCDAVKLEGGSDMTPVVRAIVKAGIPVCGHIGLTPQTATMLSGYRSRERTLKAPEK
jgi:3-methyl-2-oxobutanoate hydroxymethyltransferase